MERVSNREKILTEGLKVVHAQGFANASVRDIVAAAGVPQGSFTNHFESKEAFGLEILDLYFANNRAVMEETLLNDALDPLKRLRQWIDRNAARNECSGFRNGCLIGNFTAEAAAHSEAMRKRLIAIIAEIHAAIATCLKAAVKAGELPKGFDCSGTAEFIFTGLQGATLMAKAEGNAAPIDRFKKTLFAKVLR
ncbi:MAG TPA: TetR family transcriptional regulator C-terminal domain-containing protein [Rhizomicrobium sp.]|jgi:TetR/AcrR family transcriptional repressor of nem operon